MKHLHSIMIVAAVSLLLLTGCGGTQPTMHYYQLAPTALPVTSGAEGLSDLAIEVGPVTIPEMLKRQEIVIRGEGNEYRLTELHRWAGLLEKDLTAVIIENLGKQLGTEKVVSYPSAIYFEPDYRVIIEILGLTGKPGELVTLRAGWTIVDHSGEQILERKISEYQQQLTDPSIDSLVQAESQVIALLCQEISNSLRLNRP
jgi:uncharacterized lipoprotein YmbA